MRRSRTTAAGACSTACDSEIAQAAQLVHGQQCALLPPPTFCLHERVCFLLLWQPCLFVRYGCVFEIDACCAAGCLCMRARSCIRRSTRASTLRCRLRSQTDRRIDSTSTPGNHARLISQGTLASHHRAVTLGRTRFSNVRPGCDQLEFLTHHSSQRGSQTVKQVACSRQPSLEDSWRPVNRA